MLETFKKCRKTGSTHNVVAKRRLRGNKKIVCICCGGGGVGSVGIGTNKGMPNRLLFIAAFIIWNRIPPAGVAEQCFL
jgi:hypothetical protein